MELKEKAIDVIDNVKDFVSDNSEDIITYAAAGAVLLATVAFGHALGYSEGYKDGIDALLETSYRVSKQ